MLKQLIKKVGNLNNFSAIAIKAEIILSIGYFIMAIITKSTINYSNNVIREVNNISNFVNLGIINFFISFVLGFIFNKKKPSN